MTRSNSLRWGLRIGWGVGSLGAATLINAVTFMALFYFTGVLGLSPALAGALLFLAKCYDIVTDPVMGIVSDRTATPWGRRRPFLFAAAFVSAASFVMLFGIPLLVTDASTTLTTLLAGAALLLYATGYTMFNIPYLAMPAEMTDDYHERARLMSARVVFASLGILAGGAAGPALVTWFGGGRQGYAGMSLLLAAIIFLSMVGCFFGTRTAAHTQRVVSAMPLSEQWSTAIGNRPFVVLILSKFLHMSGVAAVSSSLLYIVTIVLGRETAAAGIFGVAATAGTILSMPVWLAACRRWGKRNAYIVGVTLYVPVLLTWLLAGPDETLKILALRGLGFGVVTGGLILTAQSMLPDTISFDAERSGLRREGAFTSMYSLAEKTAFALGPLVVGALLESAGYSAGAEPTSATVRAIWIGAVIWPAVASALSAWVLRYYELDRLLGVQA